MSLIKARIDPTLGGMNSDFSKISATFAPKPGGITEEDPSNEITTKMTAREQAIEPMQEDWGNTPEQRLPDPKDLDINKSKQKTKTKTFRPNHFPPQARKLISKEAVGVPSYSTLDTMLRFLIKKNRSKISSKLFELCDSHGDPDTVSIRADAKTTSITCKICTGKKKDLKAKNSNKKNWATVYENSNGKITTIAYEIWQIEVNNITDDEYHLFSQIVEEVATTETDKESLEALCELLPKYPGGKDYLEHLPQGCVLRGDKQQTKRISQQRSQNGKSAHSPHPVDTLSTQNAEQEIEKLNCELKEKNEQVKLLGSELLKMKETLLKLESELKTKESENKRLQETTDKNSQEVRDMKLLLVQFKQELQVLNPTATTPAAKQNQGKTWSELASKRNMNDVRKIKKRETNTPEFQTTISSEMDTAENSDSKYSKEARDMASFIANGGMEEQSSELDTDSDFPPLKKIVKSKFNKKSTTAKQILPENNQERNAMILSMAPTHPVIKKQLERLKIEGKPSTEELEICRMKAALHTKSTTPRFNRKRTLKHLYISGITHLSYGTIKEFMKNFGLAAGTIAHLTHIQFFTEIIFCAEQEKALLQVLEKMEKKPTEYKPLDPKSNRFWKGTNMSKIEILEELYKRAMKSRKFMIDKSYFADVKGLGKQMMHALEQQYHKDKDTLIELESPKNREALALLNQKKRLKRQKQKDSNLEKAKLEAQRLEEAEKIINDLKEDKDNNPYAPLDKDDNSDDNIENISSREIEQESITDTEMDLDNQKQVHTTDSDSLDQEPRQKKLKSYSGAVAYGVAN